MNGLFAVVNGFDPKDVSDLESRFVTKPYSWNDLLQEIEHGECDLKR